MTNSGIGLTSEDGFRLSGSGGAVRLSFDRAPANVLDIGTLHSLTGVVESRAGMEARVLLLSGSPHFCAGVEIADHVPGKIDAMLSAVHAFLRSLLNCPALTIAAIRGACLGGGAEIALACDIVLCAEDARFGLPEITLACFPPAAALLLPAAVGSGRAMDLLTSGRTISGREAERIGLASRTFAAADLDARADRFVLELLSRSPAALESVRTLVREPKRRLFEAGIEKAEDSYRRLAETPGLGQAINKFLRRAGNLR